MHIMPRILTASIRIMPPPRNSLPQEILNENETIIGISEESCPKPLKLFEAWSASMQKLDA